MMVRALERVQLLEVHGQSKTVLPAFKFLDGSGSNGTGITWGSVTINSSAPNGSGTIDKGYFNFNHDVFSYNNSNYYGDWSVYL